MTDNYKGVALDSTFAKSMQMFTKELESLLPDFRQAIELKGDFVTAKVIEMLLAQTLIPKYVGVPAEFTHKNGPNTYILNISLSGKGKIILSHKLSLDLLKAAKKDASVKDIVTRFKREMYNVIHSVNAGEDPFDESFNEAEYILFEVEAAAGPIAGPLNADSMGTLASFKGVLPVEKVSLVDTDGSETDYVAKEVKKDHFVLHPTSEEILREKVISNLYNKKLSESDFQKYIHIARTGKYHIIKEHISESANYHYKKLGNSITLSTIRYNKEK